MSISIENQDRPSYIRRNKNVPRHKPTKTVVLSCTAIPDTHGTRKLIRDGSKVDLLPNNPNKPDGGMGACLTKECRLLLLKTLGVRGPYVVSKILKATNGQVLLCFNINGREVMLRSIYFRKIS